MLITPEQVRAARALLRLDQATVARDAGVSVITLRRLEDAHGLAKVSGSAVDAVRVALEKQGAEFIPDGVRRRERDADEIAAIRRRIDKIVAVSAEHMAKNPPLTDDELYEENDD